METKAFETLRNNMDEAKADTIKSIQVFDNLKWEIGTVFGIPAVSILHPSSRDWMVSKYFISLFLFLHDLIIHEFPDKSLKEIRKTMRNELNLWKQRIQAVDEL